MALDTVSNATLAAYATDQTIDPVTIGVIGFMAVGILVIWAGYVWLTFFQLLNSLRVVHAHPQVIYVEDPPVASLTTLFRLFTRPKERQFVPWLFLPAKLEANDADVLLRGSPTSSNHREQDRPTNLRLWCDGAASFVVSWPQAAGTRVLSGRALLFATTGDIIDYVKFNVQHQRLSLEQYAHHDGMRSGVFEDEVGTIELSDMAPQLTGSGWIRASGDQDEDFVGGVAMTITEPTETPLTVGPRPIVQMIGFCLSREQAEQMAMMIATDGTAPASLHHQATSAGVGAFLDATHTDSMHAMAWILQVVTKVSIGNEEPVNERVVLCWACDCVGQGIVPNSAPHRQRVPAAAAAVRPHHHHHGLDSDVEHEPPDGRGATPPPEAVAALARKDASPDVDDERDLFSACSDEIQVEHKSPVAVEPVRTPLTPQAAVLDNPASEGHRAVWDPRTGRFVADQTSSATETSFGYIDVVPRLIALCYRDNLYTLKPLYNTECLDEKSHPTTPGTTVTPTTTTHPHGRRGVSPQSARLRHGPKTGFQRDERSDSDEDVDDLDDAVKCIICFAYRKVVVTVPCLHFNLCPQCAAKLDQCPECRAVIEAKVIVGV